MRILVVDDDIASLETLCNMLRTCGHKVDTAANAQVAIRMMGTVKYSMIFLDYNMPVHNGVWFMRNAGIPAETPVILITGFVDPMAVSDFRRLGVEEIIQKPFTLVGLRGCLKDILAAA